MNTTAVKLIKGMSAFIATLLILFGAKFLWQNYSITIPLNKELMIIGEVEKIIVEKPLKIHEPVSIIVSLNNVSNFQKTYTEINEKVAQALENRHYKIHINDNSTNELDKLYTDISLYVEKSLIDGNFPELVEKGQKLAEAIDAETIISIDDIYIYVHIAKTDKDLYKLVPRR
ncbi:MAG: hypothetical protein GX201_08170 [Clostridiales bacterium]|nr:hypothetical protein [Clostridiales bacterium]